MTFQEKKDALTNNGEDNISLVLDDLIHDIKSREATALNNEGIDAQLSFLFYNCKMSVEDIQAEIC